MTCHLVVKSIQQSPPPGSESHLGARGCGGVVGETIACARKLVHDGGVRALYRGYWWTLVRAGPVAGVLLPCFDITLALLERAQQRLKRTMSQ